MYVVHAASPQLYRVLGHGSVYYRYGVRGCRFRVYKYDPSFIHVCCFYWFDSELPF